MYDVYSHKSVIRLNDKSSVQSTETYFENVLYLYIYYFHYYITSVTLGRPGVTMNMFRNKIFNNKKEKVMQLRGRTDGSY